jgi:hypothetical protein
LKAPDVPQLTEPRLSVMKKEKRRRRRPANRQPEGRQFVLKKSDEPENSGVEGFSLERR